MTALQSDLLPVLFGRFLELWHVRFLKEILPNKREFREKQLSDKY
jgi:hypothetical protein